MRWWRAWPGRLGPGPEPGRSASEILMNPRHKDPHSGLESGIVISIVTPAHNERNNLPVLYQGLSDVLAELKMEWEWIIVDDHSSDDTFAVIQSIAAEDARVKGLRLSRNCGFHVATTCGLHYTSGDCSIIIAADMQDPPETIPDLVAKWRSGCHVVWAVRQARLGEKRNVIVFSRLYYFLMRHFVGLKDMASTGSDFLLMDRVVVDAFSRFKEQNISILALINWMGFKQASIYYEKQARLHGSSSWNFKKKIKLVVDSVTAFTHSPIRIMSYMGIGISLLGLLYTIFLIWNRFLGNPPTGWTGLVCVVLIMGGFQITMLGILGEYIWRTLEESRRRPLYMIEDLVGSWEKPDLYSESSKDI